MDPKSWQKTGAKGGGKQKSMSTYAKNILDSSM